jgi:hypothetical protein
MGWVAAANLSPGGRLATVWANSSAGPSVALQEGGGAWAQTAQYGVARGAPSDQVGIGRFGTAGLSDLLVWNQLDGVTALLNCGDGGFAVGFVTDGGVPQPVQLSAFALGDIDGDGFDDVVVVTGDSTNPSSSIVVIMSRDGGTSYQTSAEYPLAFGVFAPVIVVADVDSDSRADVLLASAGNVWLMRNEDGGVLGSPTLIGRVGGSICLIAIDLSGDGLVDLVSSDLGDFSVFLNQGGGAFGAPANYLGDPTVGLALGFAAADLEGNGRPDIVQAAGQAAATVWRNNGDGSFAPGQVVQAPYASGGDELALADLNGDGRIDLLVTVPDYSAVLFFPGRGDGTFVDASGVALQKPMPQAPWAIGDVNGDGAPDLVLAGVVYLDDGGAPTTQMTFAFPQGVTAIDAVDMNRDGQGDIVAAGTAVFIALNDGGNFPLVSAYPVADSGVASIAVADFNGDGWPDVAAALPAEGSISVLLNIGGGQLAPARRFDAGSAPTQLISADFNVDGHADLAVLESTTGIVDVLLGRGDGTFAPPQSFNVDPNASLLSATDMNGDGTSDLVVADGTSGSVSILFGSDGGLSAMSTVMLPTSPFTMGPDAILSMTITDLNSDGRPDIVVGDYYGVTVLFSQEDGGFLPRQYIAGPYLFEPALGAADFNGDGRPELVVDTGVLTVQPTRCLPWR